jgi:hypothetical protein
MCTQQISLNVASVIPWVGQNYFNQKKKSLRDYVFHEVRKFNNQVKS